MKQSFQYGGHTVTLDTGRIARQADGAVVVSMADTVVLVTAVARKEADPQRDFLPLTVNYQEKTYAAGRIPGGFFKREGPPRHKETLTSRLIDRTLRPLFPKDFRNEVQVVATVLSLDPEINPDIPAMLGASAALALSGVPFGGPIGAARVGYIDGEYVLNPATSRIDESGLDLVVAGTADAVVMVESEADCLAESVMLGAVQFGHEQMQAAVAAIRALAEQAGQPRWEQPAPAAPDAELTGAVDAAAGAALEAAYDLSDKQARQTQLKAIRSDVLEQLAGGDTPRFEAAAVGKRLGELESQQVRGRVLDGRPRIDGRDTRTVRPLDIQVGLLGATHGSALFTRGETQALVTVTLGAGRDAQIVDALEGEYKDNFMLHYNFPPYCVGETGFMGSPKRREIGHGKLARRAIEAVLPDMEEYPYVIRVVSEITESNGSSSMASVCGTSLALMDAGVPVTAAVAGVAMGLVKDGERYAVLTDIMGDEDHLGDMDFKVAGTAGGVTALQMDIKIDGLSSAVMEEALDQAREARLHILAEMNQVIEQSRPEMSDHAPRILTVKVPVEKIRDVIGKGGAVIRGIAEETGATVDIDDDGTVRIFSTDKAACEAARERVEQITADVEVGKVYDGRVAKIMDFGAFVTVLPGKDGLVHISQIADERVENVRDKLSEGDTVRVKVLNIDNQGRVKLSMKEVEAEA